MKNLTAEGHARRNYTEVIRVSLRTYLYLTKSRGLEGEEIRDAFHKLTGYHVDPSKD